MPRNSERASTTGLHKPPLVRSSSKGEAMPQEHADTLYPPLKRVRSNHQREWGYWIEGPDRRCVGAVCSGVNQGVESNGLVSAWNNTLAKGINPEAVPDLLEQAEAVVLWAARCFKKSDSPTPLAALASAVRAARSES